MRIQTLKNQSFETTRHSCLVHLFFLLYYCVSIYYRSQLVDICDNDFNYVDNGPRWGSITDKARTLWWNNMTNDSTYQMDNALLISDEPNGIFSDMEIIGRPGSCLCFALLCYVPRVVCILGSRRISVSRSCKAGSWQQKLRLQSW